MWEPSTDLVTSIKGMESKVTKILTKESKMFVSLLNKIKIYDKFGIGEYKLCHETTFG